MRACAQPPHTACAYMRQQAAPELHAPRPQHATCAPAGRRGPRGVAGLHTMPPVPLRRAHSAAAGIRSLLLSIYLVPGAAQKAGAGARGRGAVGRHGRGAHRGRLRGAGGERSIFYQ